MYNGTINVYKEAGYTSNDVVAKMRGICRQRKIGHTGTLDPDAVGVLPVVLGSATKLCDMLTDWEKEYIAVMRLGVVTDTQDASGQILKEMDSDSVNTLPGTVVSNAIRSFQGEYSQIPPMYSALKINGKKLYELAREGKEVERKPRLVKIKEIEIQKISMPYVTMRVVCSKGTYIRTLCHDIGEKLGCGAMMQSLERSKVGIFSKEDAITLGQLQTLADEGRIATVLVPTEEIFADKEKVFVNASARPLVLNGNVLAPNHLTAGCKLEGGQQVRVYTDNGIFVGIYGYRKEQNLLKPVKMFLPERMD